MSEALDAAKKLRAIYVPPCAFPAWSLDPAVWSDAAFEETLVFHSSAAKHDDIVRLITEREPCNIAMRRNYNKKKLAEAFGYGVGAYARSTQTKLEPNIAVYCHATVKRPTGYIKRHVLNLIGAALDSYEQPDYKYFKDDKNKLIEFYRKMWLLAVEAANYLGEEYKIDRIMIYNVGGGAFAGPYGDSFTEEIFFPAFSQVRGSFRVPVVGFDFNKKVWTSPRIPDCLDAPDAEKTLFVNAWDPWSMIGNGNAMDNSLDGHWGRISNMAVLGWPCSNPQIKFFQIPETVFETNEDQTRCRQ